MLSTSRDHLRHRGVGALAHVDGAAIERGRAVGRHVDDGDRRGRRDHRLDGDGEAAAALDVAVAALVERLATSPSAPAPCPSPSRSGASFRIWPVACGRPSRSEVLPAELDRIHLQRPRHHVGVALIGPHQLRHAEAAQRAGRRDVGVERVGIDPDVVDVVGAGRGRGRTSASRAGRCRHRRRRSSTPRTCGRRSCRPCRRRS